MTRNVKVLIQSVNAAVLAGMDATLRGSDGASPTSVVARVQATEYEFQQLLELRPDVVVRHVSGTVHSLAQRGDGAIPVVLAVDDRVSGAEILRMLRRGIKGVISVTEDLAGLPRACQEVARGSAYLSTCLVNLLTNHLAGRNTGTAFGLTAREVQVLRCLTAGRSSSEIADHMKIDNRTVKYHLANIYRKLDVRGRTGAVAFAYREGLVA